MNKFDLKTIYHKDRPLSWSGISAFEWNPKQWYEKYVEKQEFTSPAMEFGKLIDKRVQDDPKFLPELPRYPIQQHEMRTIWNGIPLIGYSDQYRPRVRPAKNRSSTSLSIRDLKTGKESKPWTQKRADETGQLTMYLFMLYLMDKTINVADAELYIDWLPTHIKDGEIALVEPVKVHTFKTKRTMTEILKFGQRILTTWAEMEEYASRQVGSVVHDRKDW